MEKIFDIIVGLLKGANWAEILKVLSQTVETFMRIIGAK